MGDDDPESNIADVSSKFVARYSPINSYSFFFFSFGFTMDFSLFFFPFCYTVFSLISFIFPSSLLIPPAPLAPVPPARVLSIPLGHFSFLIRYHFPFSCAFYLLSFSLFLISLFFSSYSLSPILALLAW